MWKKPARRALSRATTMAMSIYMSKIACDDLHLAIVKKYSDSDSPFGHVDVFSLGAALKSALEVECGRTNISLSLIHI